MLGRDIRDHADVGLRDGGQIGQLADLARAELADAQRVSRLQPEERQGQAEAVVEVAMSGECRHVRGTERGEHVLGGRLAIRSGDADHLPAPRTTHLTGDGPERPQRLVGLQYADPFEGPRATRPAKHGDGSGGRDLVQEVVPVGSLALERAEQRSRPRAARVADNARDASRRVAAEQSRPFERPRLEWDHPPTPSSSRATLRSSNGSTTPPMSWPCSWPLPRMRTRSPPSASARARAIARLRSCSTSASEARSIRSGSARLSARSIPSAGCRS